MARSWIEDLVGDHLHAWSALAAAATEVVELPRRTAQRLVGAPVEPSAPEPPTDGGRIAALEARLRELGEAHDAQLEGLRGAYARLELEAAGRAARAEDDQKLMLYRRLEPLLAQLPAVRHAVAQGREVAATDLLDLLTPLDDALGELGFVTIGAIGDTLPFDPAEHQATGVTPGEPVVVKSPGQRLGDKVLRRARVSKAT